MLLLGCWVTARTQPTATVGMMAKKRQRYIVGNINSSLFPEPPVRVVVISETPAVLSLDYVYVDTTCLSSRISPPLVIVVTSDKCSYCTYVHCSFFYPAAIG